ncbi:unnamed protein product, partial [Prorocentrum cordatum]
SVIDGVAAGERWCTASRRPNADLWRQVWARLRDVGLGPNGVQFRKANKAADERAGRRAECGTNVMLQYIDEACNAAAEKIHYMLNFQAEITTRVLDEHSQWPDVQELPKSRQGARWSVAPLQVLQDECCRGHVAANLPMVFATAGAFSNGHQLWKTSTWVWCQRCGQHAQRRLAGLRGGCNGRPKRPWHLANLRAGRAPKAHVDDPPVGVPARLTEAEREEWQ